MEKYSEKRGKYNITYYEVNVTQNMRMQALQFAKDIVLSDNQYSRLLPTSIRASKNVTMQQKIEIQRTYMGKLGELAFAQFLHEENKNFNTVGMLEIFEGQENVDNYDFVTVNGLSVDVKTGFRSIHTRLLVNVQQFNNLPKDYYVAVKLNAVDTDAEQKLVDWDSVSKALILGWSDYNYMNNHAGIADFGEGNARWLWYNSLMGIDGLLSLF